MKRYGFPVRMKLLENANIKVVRQLWSQQQQESIPVEQFCEQIKDAIDGFNE